MARGDTAKGLLDKQAEADKQLASLPKNHPFYKALKDQNDHTKNVINVLNSSGLSDMFD